jgi:hypothetical protein
VAPLDQLLGLADDPDKAHTYAVGTSGDRVALGRLMRREAGKLRIDRARRKYSVTDGAEWIANQYATQLPMLDENILNYSNLWQNYWAKQRAA